MEKGELIHLQVDVSLPYRWAAGHYGSIMLKALRDEKKILGNRCPQCGKVFVPPRVVCGPCFKAPAEIVELATTGTLAGYSVVNYPFIDPETGRQRPVPYTYAYIQLDGCDSYLSHFVDEVNPEKLSTGIRVEAVFRPDGERVGRMQDILHFRVIEGDREGG
jgi:uncharacterized protein